MSGTEARCGQEARTCPASEFSYPGFSSRWGVLFPKLSKLLNQGDALSAPCFSRASLAGRSTASPARAGNAAGRLDPSLLMSHYCLLHQLITPTSADELPVVGGRCTGGAHRCKVKQGCREDRADVWILASKVVRFGGRVQSEKK